MTENVPAQRPARPRVNLAGPLTDLDEAIRLADVLSHSELVPQSLQGKPANVLHVLIAGQAMGLNWAVALRTIYSPGNGQIGIRGQLLLAKLREAGHDYSWEEGDDYCTFTLTRGGEGGKSYAATFTIEHAIQAGLAKRLEDGRVVSLSRENKPLPWQQYTSRMLFWRAVSDCVTRAAPEVLLGFEIAGAEPAAGPPEVVLKPGAPAPPAPAGEAAPDGGQAAQAEQLGDLDEQMRGPRTASGEAVSPVWHVTSPVQEAQEPAAQPAQEEPAAQEAQEEDARPGTVRLAERFRVLGWPANRYRADVLRACSAFSGRRVGSSRELAPAEIARLIAALAQIESSNSAEHYPVALSDQVEKWSEQWREADPEGFAAYEGGKPE